MDFTIAAIIRRPAREVPMEVKVAGDGSVPQYATEGAAGADLRASSDAVLEPGARAAVPTGLRLQIPPGHVGLIWPRSGLAVRHGIDTLAGVVDCDYRGEVQVVLVNHGADTVRIAAGERIAQILFQKVERASLRAVDALEHSARGAGGFGSSGR
jgi:dUTP pyrophosphatase